MRAKGILWGALIVALLAGALSLGLGGGQVASAQTGGGFDLTWHVMGAGGAGGPLSGGGFEMRSTVSQLAIGPLADGTLEIGQGYWYGVGPTTFGIYLPVIFKAY